MNTELLEKAGAWPAVLREMILDHGLRPAQFEATAAADAAELEKIHGQSIPGLAAAIAEAYWEIWEEVGGGTVPPPGV